MEEKRQKALSFLQEKLNVKPKLAIILGSGLGGFADRLEHTQYIPTSEIPFYPESTVEGHSGYWVIGVLKNKTLVAVRGRIHFYEGYSMNQVTYPIQLLAQLGIHYLIVTNAAGSLNPRINPGCFMIIEDHINLFFMNPLIGLADKMNSVPFVDMSAPYDPSLMQVAQQSALDQDIRLEKGILCGTSGPAYESAAEVRMMRQFGCDAATMSTIPEVLMARQLGLKVLGISCITNFATGISQQKLDHHDVTNIAAMVSSKFQTLMTDIISRLLEQG